MSEVRKIALGIALSLVVAGLINAVALWYRTESFFSSQQISNARFESTSKDLTDAVVQLKIQTAELKEQGRSMDERLRRLEDHRK